MFPLAEFTPLSAQAQLAIISLLGVAVLLLTIRSFFRRQPPLDTELVKLNGAIEALRESVNQLHETAEKSASHAAEIEALQEKVRSLERHREDDQRANRSYTRESTERIFKHLDELKDSVNSNFQAVERALGQLEGKVGALSDTR